MTEIVIPPRGNTKKVPLHKRVNVDIDADAVKARFWSKRTIIWIITRFVLFGVLMSCLATTARVASTYFAVYPVSPMLLVSPEDERWEMSSYPIVRLVRFINQNVPVDARIMVFRQSDIAYYTDNPIATFTDNNYAELFKKDTPEELHEALLERGIQYVALPAYGKAEVNRSAFKPLLNDGRYAVLAFEADGDRLFKILDEPIDFVPFVAPELVEMVAVEAISTLDTESGDVEGQGSTESLSSENLTAASNIPLRGASSVEALDEFNDAEPLDQNYTYTRVRDVDFTSMDEVRPWTAFIRSLGFFKTLYFGQPDLYKPETGVENAVVRIERERPFIARKYLVDILQAWPFQAQYSPIVRAKTEFPVQNGTYRISGEVEADGKVDLYIRITVLSADQVTKTFQWLLWSEVLDGETAQVQGMTAIAIAELDQLRNNLKSTDSAMLYFTLEQGGYLEVKDLVVDRLDANGQGGAFSTLVEQRSDAYVDGWTLEQLTSVVGYARPLDILQENERGEILFKQVSANSETVFSPPFILDDEQVDVLEVLNLERRGQQAPPQLNAKFKAGGNGSLKVGFFGTCSDGTPFGLDLRTYSLDPDGMALAPSREAQCVPSMVRVAFTLDRDKFLYPPNFERGLANLSDLSMTMTLWANDGQQRVVALRAAPELSTLDIKATTESSTDLGLPDLIIPNFDR